MSLPWYQCKFESIFVEHGSSIFTQVFMIFLFLTLFFFLFVVKVEKEIFDRQINLVVDNLMADWGRVLPLVMPLDKSFSDKIRADFIANLDAQSKAIDPSQFQSILNQNDQVEKSAHNVLIAFGVLVGTGLLTLFLLRFCLKPVSHFWENLLLVGFIGMTEFLFLELVIKNYTSVNPNHVKLYMIQSINNFATQQSLGN